MRNNGPQIERLRTLLGIGLVVLSAVAIGLVPTAAKLAYEGGSNTMTVITLRSLFMVMVVGVGLKLLGRSLSISRRGLGICVVTGIIFAIMSYGYLGSVVHIPISLVVLIYFLHPLFVAIIAHVSGGERLTLLRALCALVVLLGLGLALGPAADQLSGPGIGLALLAAVAVSFMILGNARAQEEANSVLVNFYMVAVTTVVLLVVTLITETLQVPATALGWVGVLGTGLGFTVGLITFFAAFPFIGAVRATMISNIEPLFGIFFAMAVFGETLSGVQWLGAALVIAGLIAMEMPEGSLFLQYLRRRRP